MGKGLAVAIVLGDAEKGALTALTRKHGAPQSLAARARIVLAAPGGLDNKAIAAKVGVCVATAGTWRNRFAERRLDGLYDEPRPGAPSCCASTRRARFRPSTARSHFCRCGPGRPSGAPTTTSGMEQPRCSRRST